MKPILRLKSQPTKVPEAKIEEWDISALHFNPLQKKFFESVGKEALKVLAEDIDANGLQEPIEIDSRGMIIAGHMRWMAIAFHLKWLKVTVKVRYDLEARGPAAIERRFLESNLNRRQLSPLGAARAYQRIKQLDATDRKANGKKATDEGGDYRDQIAKRFGYKNHRQLDRLCTLLKLPIELQRAYERDMFTQARALAITKALPAVQEQLAQLARDNKLTAKAITAVLGRRPVEEVSVKGALKVWQAMASEAAKLMGGFPLSFDALPFAAETRREQLLMRRLTGVCRVADELRARLLEAGKPVPPKARMKRQLRIPLRLRVAAMLKRRGQGIETPEACEETSA